MTQFIHTAILRGDVNAAVLASAGCCREEQQKPTVQPRCPVKPLALPQSPRLLAKLSVGLQLVRTPVNGTLCLEHDQNV